MFVQFLHVLCQEYLVTHMHILHKHKVVVVRYVGGGVKVEKETYGAIFPCTRGAIIRMVVHTICGPRFTLASGMSRTGGVTA